jgi:L-ribulose-5-phosphate 4-epimerase
MWESERKSVFEIAKKLDHAGLVVGSQGNISLRIIEASRQLIAITPSGVKYEAMKPEDIAIVDLEGKLVYGPLKPSMETMLHLEVYTRRPDVGAIIHSHSVFATALAVASSGIPPVLDDQVFYLGGEVSLAKHALPGSIELAQNVAIALKDKNAVLMANHGSLVTGRTLDEAFFNCHLLERLSRVYLYSRLLGNKQYLPPDIIEKERKMFGGGETI